MSQIVLTELGVVLATFGLALAGTLLFELPVAALFRVGRRGLAAVVLINLITNPLLNLALLVIVLTAGLGFGTRLIAAGSVPLLEAAVVIAEWRLLVWALCGMAGSSRRMLAMSVAMNLASVLGGIVLGTALSLLRLK